MMALRRLTKSGMCVLTRMFALAMIITGTPVTADPNSSFAGYAEECGYPIVFSSTLAVSEAVIDRQGRLVVVLDPSLATESERDRREFLLAHECAHHQMDHALPASRRSRALFNSVVRDQELSADCWAAQLLARLGHEKPILVMTQRFHRAGLYSPGGGYPAGIQRASIIQQCAHEGRQAKSHQEKRAAMKH
jgi:hypothetical protein